MAGKQDTEKWVAGNTGFPCFRKAKRMAVPRRKVPASGEKVMIDGNSLGRYVANQMLWLLTGGVIFGACVAGLLVWWWMS